MKKKNLLLTAVATIGLAAATMAQTVPSYVPTNGLIGWWPFNGNANDESGNGNNGTVNGATLSNDRFGNAGKAYEFNGINNNIIITGTQQTNTQLPFSVSLWGKTNNPLITQTWVSTNPYGVLAGWVLMPFQYTGMNYEIAINGNWNSFVSNYTFPTNTWVNCIAVFNTNSIEIYINGTLLETKNLNFGTINYNSPSSLAFGSTTNGLNWLDGSIDDIAIWNRALTQQEITDIYNSCLFSINTQPNNQTININNDAQFIVSSSNSNVTYQWQTDLGVGFQNISNAGQYSGANNDTLTVSNVTLSNNNQQFRCIVSSGSCSDTSAVAVLTVNNNVGIHENATENTFHLFPNPASNQLTITHANPQARESYTIYNMLGEAVLTGEIQSSSMVISLSSLSPGSYFIRFSNGTQQSFRLIKE